MNKFINYAHRSASAYAPENTMSAFEKAVELKANGIELDLQKTKDGKIVIFHDDFIDKKSNGIGTTSDYTYNELLNFDFGSWFDLKYKDEKIVLFEEFAKKFLSKDLTFAIEIKTIGIEKQTLEIIDKYSKSKENIYITSFIFEALENVRKFFKNSFAFDIKTGLIYRNTKQHIDKHTYFKCHNKPYSLIFCIIKNYKLNFCERS